MKFCAFFVEPTVGCGQTNRKVYFDFHCCLKTISLKIALFSIADNTNR